MFEFDQKDMKRWGKARQVGKSRYILRSWASFSISTISLTTLFDLFANPQPGTEPTLGRFAIKAVIWIVAGAVNAWWTWAFSEKQFHQHLADTQRCVRPPGRSAKRSLR